MHVKTGYYTIYKVTSPSNKCYIGYTHFSIEDRKKQHESEAFSKKTKRPFYNALRKYKNQMKWEIINIYYTEKYAKVREKYYIKVYNAINSGYNLTKGGEGTPGLIRKSQRKAIIDNSGNIYESSIDVESKLGIPFQKVAQSIRHNRWCNTIYFSYYVPGMTVANLPITNCKYSLFKKIEIVELGLCFSKLKYAAKYLNVSEQAVSRVVRGERFTVKGYHIKYLDKEF